MKASTRRGNNVTTSKQKAPKSYKGGSVRHNPGNAVKPIDMTKKTTRKTNP